MLLILDIGTSSMRGMLMDCYGHMLKSIQKKYTLRYTPDGGVLMEMEQLDKALQQCLEEIGSYCAARQRYPEGISTASLARKKPAKGAFRRFRKPSPFPAPAFPAE